MRWPRLLAGLILLGAGCAADREAVDLAGSPSMDLAVQSVPDLTSAPTPDLTGVPAPDLTGAPADLGTTTTALTIGNPSFESPATGPASFITSAAPPSWTAFGSINNGYRAIGVVNPATTTLYLDPVPAGANLGVVFLVDDPQDEAIFASSPAGLQQTLAAVLLVQSEYTLTVEVGNMNFFDGSGHDFAFTGFPGYRVELLAGGMVIASDVDTLLPGEGRFLTSTVVYTTGATDTLAGEPLGIRLVNRNAAAGIEVNFDDVRLVRRPL